MKYKKLREHENIRSIKLSAHENERYVNILKDFNDMRDFYKDAAKSLVVTILFNSLFFDKAEGLDEDVLVKKAAETTCGKDTWGTVKDSKDAIIGAALSLMEEGSMIRVIRDIQDTDGSISHRRKIYSLTDDKTHYMMLQLNFMRGDRHLGSSI